MSKHQKTTGQQLSDKLTYEPLNGWKTIQTGEKDEMYRFCDHYKTFLNIGKTEREAILYTIERAEENGFVSLEALMLTDKILKPGDKVYTVNREKGIMFVVIGKQDMTQGIHLVGAHMDTPRIDLKQNPIYEDSGIALLKTHYYGGIKKYQWTALPLALHGLVIKKDGTKIQVVIGEDDKDPVFCITDLLPHLAQNQMQKKMTEGVTGEGLNVLFGSIGYQDEKVKEKVKLNILNLLHEKYGIIEQDFVSAELQIVPAFKARDVGFDASMVGGYGQDDRVCSYAAIEAVLAVEAPEKTAVCLLVDKEEVGSMGNTGMQSRFFENQLAEIYARTIDKPYNDLMLRRILNASKCLSADVSAALDPTYPDVHDKRNAPFINKGVVITKYTGARGKAGASDANAEFVGEIRALFEREKIVWQTGELGKVDQGGGGTIAQFVANLNMEVVDCGVPLLSMHSPFEVAAKLDIYMTYKAYKSFYMA